MVDVELRSHRMQLSKSQVQLVVIQPNTAAQMAVLLIQIFCRGGIIKSMFRFALKRIIIPHKGKSRWEDTRMDISDYVGLISGPARSDKIRFFGTVENQFNRDPVSFTYPRPGPPRDGMQQIA